MVKLRRVLSAAGAAALWAQPLDLAGAQDAVDGSDDIPIDADDIAGVVRSTEGVEAGVWVIAETNDLGTQYRKIVVTDDEGRFLLPDLPEASYDIWVRGYGLVDSEPVQADPGRHLSLTAVVAPSERAAAQYYPANYWYSLIELPPESDFPGAGVDSEGNGVSTGMATLDHWINQMKTGCNVCHQLGNLATREFPPGLGEFESSIEAWSYRTQVGQDGSGMISAMGVFGRQRALEMFADWTDRIAAGETPPRPPRPEGIERNVVLTLWDWGGPATFAHDELSTDKRNPTANAYGPIYGVDWGNDGFLILDPIAHAATETRVPVLDPDTPVGKPQSMPQPSPYWGDELYWFDQAIPNHAAMDSQGRVWMSGRFRKPEDQPDYCTAGHPSAELAPLDWSFRQMQYYDPRTQEFHQVDICYDTHHVQFAEGEDDIVYGNGVFSGAIGWVNARVLDETGDVEQAQGWCRPYYDIDGDGQVNPSVDRLMFASFLEGGGSFFGVPDPEPDAEAGEGAENAPVLGPSVLYSIIAHPSDGSVWAAMPGPMPGRIVRLDPNTCIGEAYEPPFNNPASDVNGYTPRGIDVDSRGVIWTALAGSGQLASFDRNKCEVLTGPASLTGQHCPEGWTLYRAPGPGFEGASEEIAVDFHYYNFVDRHNTLGLGEDVPVANGSTSDSLLALLPDGDWVTLRVPYPMGFFTRGMDGRIDDPDAGWKGRAMYGDYGQNAVWHTEGGLGTRSAVVKFQIRPDPLAR